MCCVIKAAAAALLACALTAAVPTPESHFGHKMGTDRVLVDWDKVVSYFRALEHSSDRIRVDELGKTAEGRPFIAATIAEPETLRNLAQYQDIQRRLADPRITTDAEAENLITRGKTVVLITCSIHSTEVASTQTAVEFAYRLLTEDRPHFRAILQNTILLLVPSLNPDGVDIVTRWYRKTLGTAFEGTSPPELYHKYVGSRQQSRLVHLLAARDAAGHRQAAQRVASADRLRRASAGTIRVANIRPALARSD